MKVGVLSVAAVAAVLVGGWMWSSTPAAEPKSKAKSKPAEKTKAGPPDGSPLQPNADGKIVLSKVEWRKRLTKQQFRVARMKETEPAFQNAYWNSKKDGVYQCVCCQAELFDSETKFDSGTGWPSFWQPIEKDAVDYRPDNTDAEPRVEVLCRRCDAHLGHVFADGPPPTGRRFCMNSASLKFVARTKEDKADAAKSGSPKR